jgi:hypothetical protein
LYPGFDGLTSPWIGGQFINIAGLSGTSDPSYPPGSRVVQAINIAVNPAELKLDMSADVSVTNATVLGGTQVNSHKNHDFKSGDALRSAGPFHFHRVLFGGGDQRRAPTVARPWRVSRGEPDVQSGRIHTQ